VCKVPELEAWQLFLVDWGYNTPEERERAAANERIKVVCVGEFREVVGKLNTEEAEAAAASYM
jgi:hypothetical protein